MSTEATTVVAIEDVRLASTSGHVMWLYKGKLRELGANMLKVALQTGKVSVVTSAPEAAAAPAAEPPREQKIAEAVHAIVEGGNPEDFTAQNKPKVAVVAAKSGIADVKAAEIEAALDV